MIMMTTYRARIYPCKSCCNSMLIALERPQSSSWLFLSLMARAGYVRVAVIHRTLTWTTGPLSCAQMLMHAIAQRGCTDIERESALKSWLREENPLTYQGNRTCVSGVTVQCSNPLSYIPSHVVRKCSDVGSFASTPSTITFSLLERWLGVWGFFSFFFSYHFIFCKVLERLPRELTYRTIALGW